MIIYICPYDIDVKVLADADFGSNWFPEEAKDGSDMARSRSGFVVSYLGCPVMCRSKIQIEIYLSSNESWYISIRKSLHNTVPII